MPRAEYRLIANTIALEHGTVIVKWKAHRLLCRAKKRTHYFARCEDASGIERGYIVVRPDAMRGLYQCEWVAKWAPSNGH